MPNSNQNGDLTFKVTGNGVKLNTAVRLGSILVAIILAFGYLTFNVKTIQAQVNANAAQNEVDKRTEIVVQHQQKQIDTFVHQNENMIDTLQQIQRELATLNTKIEERTSR